MKSIATNAVLVTVAVCIAAPLAAAVLAKTVYQAAKYLVKRGRP